MASKTTNYGLNKHSPQDFYNVEARNENWDKIDTELKNNVDAVNARVKTAELAAEVKKVVKDGSLTVADLGAEKAGAAKRERVSAKMAQALLSRLGRLKWCASKTIMVKYVRPVGVQNLKGVVRIESARRCQTT